jgi:YD repeat-containing protein
VPTGQLTSSRDEANRITSYTVAPLFDPQEGRLLEQIKPQTNKTGFQYDARGNVITKTEYPYPMNSIPNLVTSYSFPAQCTNTKTCNLPTSITDPNGDVANYEYDAATGLVTKVTYPPDQQGVARVKRLSYRSASASRLGSPGSYLRDMGPVWLLDKIQECRSSQTLANGCAAGSADEVTTSFGYGPDTGPNNLNPIEGVVTSEGVSRRTCFSYDRMGRRISETLPRADLGTCP